jgi:hypothetical protein
MWLDLMGGALVWGGLFIALAIASLVGAFRANARKDNDAVRKLMLTGFVFHLLGMIALGVGITAVYQIGEANTKRLEESIDIRFRLRDEEQKRKERGLP